MTTLAQDLGGVVLLPCPFCGGEAIDRPVSPQFWTVSCSQCQTEGPPFPSQTEATTAWNTRTHSAEIAGALRDAERWRVWRELGEHEAADIAWLNAGEERDAALDAMQQGGGE